MKKLLTMAMVFALMFTACEQPSDSNKNSGPQMQSITIRNESAYVLTDVKFSNTTFAISGSNELPSSSQSVKQVTPEEADQPGYITFTRKDIGINLRTSAPVSFADQNYMFTFTDNTVVQEQANNNNQRALGSISFLSKVAVEHGGFTIEKNDIVNLGDAVVNYPKQTDFVLKNPSTGKLILTGSDPIKISDETEAGIFSVVKPSSSEIAANGSVTFRINITTKATQIYSAKVTISSNDPDGDFSFTITATGTPPKPIAAIYSGENEISQDGTIHVGEVLLTTSKNITVTIKNEGTLLLTVDTSNIEITTVDAAAFSRTTTPGASVSVGSQTSFVIKCEPVNEGENTAILTIPTNDDSRNPVIVYLTVTGVRGYPVLQLNQGTTVIGNNAIVPFDFGRVALDTSKPLIFTIKNTGNLPLTLTGTSAVESSNTSVFSVTTQPSTTTLSPNGEVQFSVQYTPTVENTETATITIANNSAEPVFTLNVTGSGYTKKPQITVKQGTTTINPYGEYDFGSVVMTQTKDITFTIANSGEVNLTIENIEGKRVNLEDDTHENFSVGQQPFVSIVPPGSTTTFVLQFTPTTLGTNSAATVRIVSDSHTNNDFTFRVKGIGRNYQVGDIGPGGGIIFYVNNDRCKEVTSEDVGRFYWPTAVQMANNFRGGGFSNWRLPNGVEWGQINDNLVLNGFGGFLTTQGEYYWTSNENGNYANAQHFFYTPGSAYITPENKSSYFHTRAVRSFNVFPLVWWDDAEEDEVLPYYEKRDVIYYITSGDSNNTNYYNPKNGYCSIAVRNSGLLQLKITLTKRAKLSFWYANKQYSSSDNSYGAFFSINGTEMRKWTTNVDWAFAEFDLEPRENDLVWTKVDYSNVNYYLSLDDIRIYYTE